LFSRFFVCPISFDFPFARRENHPFTTSQQHFFLKKIWGGGEGASFCYIEMFF
jgi:hypothetical protein